MYRGNGVMSPNELHKFNEQNGGILLHTPREKDGGEEEGNARFPPLLYKPPRWVAVQGNS